MNKAITLENLKTFLAECKKIFALKSESISVDSVNKKLADYIKTADVDNKLTNYTKTSDLAAYIKTETVENKLTAYVKNTDLAVYAKKSDIAKAVNYKGSVNSYSDLPKSAMAVGDMYNVATADKANGIKAGDNVVYNGNSWDNMGGTIDLSGYATKEELQQKMNETPFATESDVVALFN